MIDKLLKLDLNLPVVVMSDYIIDHIIKLKSRQELFDLIDKKLQVPVQSEESLYMNKQEAKLLMLRIVLQSSD